MQGRSIEYGANSGIGRLIADHMKQRQNCIELTAEIQGAYVPLPTGESFGFDCPCDHFGTALNAQDPIPSFAEKPPMTSRSRAKLEHVFACTVRMEQPRDI